MSKRNRNSFLDRVAAFLLNAVLALTGLLSYRNRLGLAGWLGSTVVGGVPRLRRRVSANLSYVMPEIPITEHRSIAREVGDTFGRTFYEILNNRRFRQHGAWSIPQGPGAEAVLEAARTNSGAVLVPAHIGQFEAGRAWLAAKGIACAGFYRPMDNPFINERYLQNLQIGGEPVFPKNRRGFRDLVRHLSKGGIVAILTDQYDGRAQHIDFIGKPAPTSFVAAELALKFKVPLIPAYGIRQEDGEHVNVIFEAPIPHSDAPGMMQMVNDSLARQVRQNPGQYYWLHQRWKKNLQTAEL